MATGVIAAPMPFAVRAVNNQRNADDAHGPDGRGVEVLATVVTRPRYFANELFVN
jgi:hypothetical protein